MKRIGSILLALLAGILAPVLIWVGLFVVIRQPLVRVAKRATGLALVLLAGVATPFLIWVGMFVAVKERVQEWQLQRAPSRTIGDILRAAGLALEETPYDGETSAETIFVPRPIPEIRGMMARAGL